MQTCAVRVLLISVPLKYKEKVAVALAVEDHNHNTTTVCNADVEHFDDSCRVSHNPGDGIPELCPMIIFTLLSSS